MTESYFWYVLKNNKKGTVTTRSAVLQQSVLFDLKYQIKLKTAMSTGIPRRF